MSDTPASKPRNLWPAGIIATFVLFIAGTVGLVVLSARHNVELVSPDYYECELRYQEQINRRERTQALPEQARVSYDAANRQITVVLPPSHANRAEGEIQLYRPSAAGMDRRVTLQPDAQGRQMLDAATLTEGLWRVRLTWRVGGEEFVLEEKLVVGAGAPESRFEASPPAQIRSLKTETRNQPEARKTEPAPAFWRAAVSSLRFALNLSKFGFRVCFGFRISDFGFPTGTLPG